MPLAVLGIETYAPNILWTIWTACIALLKAIFWPKSYDVIVLEYGIDTAGDMDWLLSIVTPHMSIFTTLDVVHALQMEKRELILQEKMKLLQATHEVIFTSVQAEYVTPYLEHTAIDWLTYDLMWQWEGDISFGGHYLQEDPEHVVVARFAIHQEIDKVAEITTNLLGKEHAAYISLGVQIAMILERRLQVEHIISGEEIEKETFIFELQPSRFTLLYGQYGSVLIDSSYNAAPQSMRLTIENAISLRNQIFPDKELIYCLGDMRELGDYAETEHRALANIVAKSADAIYLVGEYMTSICTDELQRIWFNMQRVHTFVSSKELWEQLLQDIPLRDKTAVILFKGSQNTIFLEEAVKPLLKDPKDREKLCRQTAWWMSKKSG